LISRKAIDQAVCRLGDQINTDFAREPLTLVIVLKGAVFFGADLARVLRMPLTMEFIRAQSYRGDQSSGQVIFRRLSDPIIADRNVLIVEDILDTGRTTAALFEDLRRQAPARLALCTLLDKPEGRKVASEADYTGFQIPNYFVIGYGLDYNERYRELPAIHIMEEFPPSADVNRHEGR